METLIQHHIHARVDRHGRGLKRHMAISWDSAINATSALLSGIGQASGDYVAILNGDDQVVCSAGLFAMTAAAKLI